MAVAYAASKTLSTHSWARSPLLEEETIVRIYPHFCVGDPCRGYHDEIMRKQGDKTTAAEGLSTALLLCAAFLLFGFNNANTSLMPEFFLEHGASPLIAGVQNSLCVLTAIGLRFLFGPLADRVGSKPLLVIGALGFLAPCAFMPLCTDEVQLLSLRLIQAVGLAAFHPNVAHYLSRNGAASRAPQRIGWSRFASTASLMVIPALLLPLAADGAWGQLFTTMTAMVFAALVLLMFLPRNNQESPSRSIVRSDSHRPIAPKEPSAPSGAAATVPATNSDKNSEDQAVLLRDRRALGALVALPLFLSLGYSMILVFGPLFMSTIYPQLNSGFLLSAVSVGGLVATVAAPRLLTHRSKLLGTRGAVALFGALFDAGLLGLGTLSHSLLGTVFSALLCGLGYFGATTLLIAALGLRAPRNRSGRFLALQQNCLDLGIVLGSFLGGLLLQASLPLSLAFAGSSLICLLSLVVWVMLFPAHNQQL